MKLVGLLLLFIVMQPTPALFAQRDRIPESAYRAWSAPQSDLPETGVWEFRITGTRQPKPTARTYKRLNNQMRLVIEDRSGLGEKASEGKFSVGVLKGRKESFRFEKKSVDGKWKQCEIGESNFSGMVVGCEWCLRQGTHVDDRIDYARFLKDEDTVVKRVWEPEEGVLRIRCKTERHGGEDHTVDFDTDSWRAIRKVIRRRKGSVTTIELTYDNGELVRIDDTLESPAMSEPVTTTFEIREVSDIAPEEREYTKEFYGLGEGEAGGEGN